MVNYGARVTIKVPDEDWDVYMNVTNFYQYNMIISTPFIRDNKVQLDFANDLVIINGVPILAQKLELDNTDGHLQCFQTMEKCHDERPPWLTGPWAAARVEDIGDSKEGQDVCSFSVDSLVLLMMEEEHRDTLWEGEKWGVEAP